MQESVTSRKNPAVQQMRRLLRDRDARRTAGCFAAEGTKLFQEAVRWCPKIKTVFCTKEIRLPQLSPDVQVYLVPDDLLAYISSQEAPQGIIFSAEIPDPEDVKLQPGMLVLDGIQDPGNVGTILRTADALGVKVVLSDGCADPFHPRTIRAAMGAVFRSVPLVRSRKQLLEDASGGVPIAVTALSQEAQDIRSVHLKDYALVIGSEGQGVSDDFIQAASRSLIIPMRPECESLNAAAAAAIVIWQMQSE